VRTIRKGGAREGVRRAIGGGSRKVKLCPILELSFDTVDEEANVPYPGRRRNKREEVALQPGSIEWLG
jgi:hypothetical protein